MGLVGPAINELRPVSVASGGGEIGFLPDTTGFDTVDLDAAGLTFSFGRVAFFGAALVVRGIGGLGSLAAAVVPSHEDLTLLCALAIRVFNSGFAFDSFTRVADVFRCNGVSFSFFIAAANSGLIAGSKYFGGFSEIDLDVGRQTGSSVFDGTGLVPGSKARNFWLLVALPVGFQTGSLARGFADEGGALDPINLGRLIEPPGRHTGGVLEKEVVDFLRGFGVLSRRTRRVVDVDRGRPGIKCF